MLRKLERELQSKESEEYSIESELSKKQLEIQKIKAKIRLMMLHKIRDFIERTDFIHKTDTDIAIAMGTECFIRSDYYLDLFEKGENKDKNYRGMMYYHNLGNRIFYLTSP